MIVQTEDGPYTIPTTESGKVEPTDLSVKIGLAVAKSVTKLAVYIAKIELDRCEEIEATAHRNSVSTRRKYRYLLGNIAPRTRAGETLPPRHDVIADEALGRGEKKITSKKVRNLAKMLDFCEADSVKAFCKAENVKFGDVLQYAAKSAK